MPIVLAYDAATRELDAAQAARRHRRSRCGVFCVRGVRMFKKIDSTLRGHPAEEIAAMLDVILADEPAPRVVLAPSFPAMGRTVRDGQVHVHGVAAAVHRVLARRPRPGARQSRQPARERGTARAQCSIWRRYARIPATACRRSRTLATEGSAAVAVCDAETEDDLERIATASLAGDRPTFFIGSAGLAHALAQMRFARRRRRAVRLIGASHRRAARWSSSAHARAHRVPRWRR